MKEEKGKQEAKRGIRGTMCQKKVVVVFQLNPCWQGTCTKKGRLLHGGELGIVVKGHANGEGGMSWRGEGEEIIRRI
jgi:hypothetical protein